MLAVLSDLTGLHLLADYRNGPEQVSYDNIMLVPEHSTLTALLVSVGAGIGLLRRRAKSKPGSFHG